MKKETRSIVARELLILAAICVFALCLYVVLASLGLNVLGPLALPKWSIPTMYFLRWVGWAYRESAEHPEIARLADRWLRAAGLALIITGLALGLFELLGKSPKPEPVLLGLLLAAPGGWLLWLGNREKRSASSEPAVKPAHGPSE